MRKKLFAFAITALLLSSSSAQAQNATGLGYWSGVTAPVFGAISATSIKVGDGTKALPSIAFTSSPGTGFSWLPGSSALVTSVGGSALATQTAGTSALASPQAFGWSSSSDPTAAGPDTVLRRVSAGAVIFDDTASSFSHLIFGASTTSGLRLTTSVGSSQFLFREGDNSGFAAVAVGAFDATSIANAGAYGQAAVATATIGTADSNNVKVRSIAAIANATATDVFTVTVPNAAHAASIKVRFLASLGAGGAIGANEASGTIEYGYAVTRTVGVATVVVASAAYGSSTAAVAGATTITVTSDVSAIAGAAGASQTFTIRVTISRGGGASSNHTCRAVVELINANATGITIS